MAVSALEEGILFVNQDALMFYDNIGFHDFEGIAFDVDECKRLAASIGPHYTLMLRNHGLLTAGSERRRGVCPDVLPREGLRRPSSR